MSLRQKSLLARKELKNALRICRKYIITWAAYVYNFTVIEFDMTVNMYRIKVIKNMNLNTCKQ